MSPTSAQNPISRLNRISDADAARAVSPQTLADLAAAIVATPAPPPAPARRRRRLGGSPRLVRRPALALAVVTGVLTALVLGLTGVLSGQSPTEPQPADAAVLRGAAAALAHPPGSIVIDFDSDVQKTNLKFLKFAPGYKPPHGIQTVRWSNHEITETPVGNGPQNEVNLGGPSVTNGVQVGEVNGNNELYDPTTNTVYISSNYGSDITAGAKPGTFVYTLPKLQGAPPGSGAAQENAHRPPPLTITATQAQALRNGTDAVQVNFSPKHPDQNRMKITPAFRVTPTTAEIHTQLQAGKLKVDGPTTINGRKAIRLTSIHGPYGYEYDVAPGSYYPIKEIFHSRAITVTTIYSEYRVLPTTPANQRLLSLPARHPGARIDHNPADYRAAQARLITGS
jgi:hypothetical protein